MSDRSRLPPCNNSKIKWLRKNLNGSITGNSNDLFFMYLRLLDEDVLMPLVFRLDIMH